MKMIVVCNVFFFNFYVKDNTILFEDKKSITQQIKFDGIPFIGNRMPESDCVQLIPGFGENLSLCSLCLKRKKNCAMQCI